MYENIRVPPPPLPGHALLSRLVYCLYGLPLFAPHKLQGVLFACVFNMLHQRIIPVPANRHAILVSKCIYYTFRRNTFGPRRKKICLRGLQIANAQSSLYIHGVYSSPLFFTLWKISYLNLLRAKFQFSS